MKKNVRKSKICPILLGLGILFMTVSITSAANDVTESIQCPFESIEETKIILDSTPEIIDENFFQIISNISF